MATEQAWDDFEALKGSLEFISAQLNATLRPAFTKLNDDYTDIVSDPARVAAAAEVANLHYLWTAATIQAEISRALALRDYLIANNFIV